MKRAAVFAITAILLLYAVRELEYAGLRRNQEGEFAKLRQAFLEPHPCDILILGSSRAECQFVPQIIDSATGLHTFNIGMTGATLPFIRTSLEAYLVNSPAPKYAVLNLDLHSLGDNWDTVYKFPRYFAYLENEKLRGGLQQRDPRFPYFRYLAPYSMPYFSAHYLDASLNGWTGRSSSFDSAYDEGFTPCLPAPGLGDYDTLHLPPVNTLLSPAMTAELDSISAICKKNHIQLLLVISPLHQAQASGVYGQNCYRIRRFAQEKFIPLFDMGEMPIIHDQSYYADPAHLNRSGALYFSRIFSASLAQYIHTGHVLETSNY